MRRLNGHGRNWLRNHEYLAVWLMLCALLFLAALAVRG